ncbi:hypothetical protein BKA93DRAFT_450288 [Sparassis latifolia]
MAQPIFEEHPLEEYFELAGEYPEDMPGGVSEFTLQPSPGRARLFGLERMPSFLANTLQDIYSALYSSRSSQEQTFAERFKYDVISSSLLSSSIAAPPSATRRTFSPELPGRLQDTSDEDPSPTTAARLDQWLPTRMANAHARPEFSEIQWPILILSLSVAALSAEYYFIAIFLFAWAAYAWQSKRSNNQKADVITSTLNVVNEVISAGNVWDSAVNEAITIIETEERSIFYGPTSPQSPSSGLRVTLQSSLHTTQTQCDNVRQLLSALTDPSQLAQLSEMYAPSSPMMSSFSLDHPRPVSAPAWRQRPIAMPANKRATWNGSYASLASAGSPTAHLMKRKQRTRSGLSVLSNANGSNFESMSAPVSPQFSDTLPDVQEEGDDASSSEQPSSFPSAEYFGAAALGMHRKRRSAGMETFGILPPSYTTQPYFHLGHGPSPPPTITSSSRFTPVHTTRHPLSLSGLRLALHGALSAKRYACSHLLALRFDEDDEDECYWEDVRSVMALLTSTFEDASSRLVEALDDAEKKRIKDQRPSPASKSRAGSPAPIPIDGAAKSAQNRCARTMSEIVSFAPMPSHLSRFAAHVDAIATSLNDARDHLEQCVTVLREQASPQEVDEDSLGLSSVQDHPAFQAYDRLRKELGFALRECERGRERLLDIISPSPVVDDVNSYGDDTPALGQDTGSEQSDRHIPASPALDQPDIASISGEQEALGLGIDRGDEDLDDATEHLLLTTSSKHLPPPGLEQVFQADSGDGPLFTRERSRLSREERIRLAKAKRENGVFGSLTLSEPPPQARLERWAPGGEVVQELKDVIWKVGEKRRRMGMLERLDAPLESEQSMELQPQAFYTPRTYRPLTLEDSPTS